MIGYEDVDIKLEIKNGIMWGTYKDGVVINKDVSSKMIKERIKFSKGKSYPLLGDSLGVKYWTMSSRNNDMKEEAYNLMSHLALVLPSRITSTIWNFTIRLFPPPIPTKVFYDLEDAEVWLREKM